MINYDEPNISQLTRSYETNEKIYYNQLMRTVLEIWDGRGDTVGEIFETVKLDRESRRYLNVKV